MSYKMKIMVMEKIQNMDEIQYIQIFILFNQKEI